MQKTRNLSAIISRAMMGFDPSPNISWSYGQLNFAFLSRSDCLNLAAPKVLIAR